MSLFYTLVIAFRFIQSTKKNSLISLISIISILCIVLGITTLIIGLSAINGFEYELKNRILSIIPHGEITAINQPYLNWNNDLIKIQKTPGVVAVSPYINFIGLLEKKNILKIIKIIGVDLSSEKTVSSLPNFILGDAWKEFKQKNNEIILGHGIAKELQILPGDYIYILNINNTYDKDKLYFQQLHKNLVKVIGVFKLNGMLDNQLAIVPLQDAQNYLGYNNGINGFKIKVNNIFKANKIVYNAGINTGNFITIKSWITDYGYMYNDIRMVRGIIYIAMILLISVACFNIISTLLTILKNKSIDIAILKTYGAKNYFIYAIFLWYGLIIGIIGCFFGLLIGISISLNLTDITKYIENIIGHPILSSDIYFIDFLPSKVRIIDILFIISITLILSILSSLYPAKKAITIAPARILNGSNNY
ncbi:Lipoprotein-releasing system transmembrane protein LolE [Candidatus Arsenophonus lipoptenae]|uniref:Lipoprotein-releasing system transmembrane protein LolE n=1 Tax=Candidatus Arsenophonus lipoptenae TaxID=634113 RepID=A0A0X9VTK6_9GAMM|nr:Lipoprotein-releasing system transmembrane protein LolE [Candidatus Arsenophonus lipoptenae]